MADADVVVIGARCGGLTAAAYLARAGRRVRVIDAREHLGGHRSAFTVEGYELDTGLHYTTADHARADTEDLVDGDDDRPVVCATRCCRGCRQPV
jgi:phytoene dehydrogenase-like protein